jgi:glycosyltransferase involved in cell wall biosynthesis
MELPIVSILLPTYNGAHFIAEAIASVQAQSHTSWELIVINDCSTDDTEQIVMDIQKKDERIVYVKNEENSGIQKSLNRGLQVAKGAYIARIDDDDGWSDREKMKRQVTFLDEHKDYVLVGTGAVIVDEHKKELTKYLMPQHDADIRKKILSKN